MLPESRLYSFIDQKEGFTLHFLEGQKLIKDLAVIHQVIGAGFNYFRDAILTFQPMIAFLKPGEGLGVYIDSEIPYFRLKIEMSDQGQMRTLLLPEDFNEFPSQINGRCRIVKLMPGEHAPYTSIINIDGIDFHQVANKILLESYQIQSEVFLSENSDQSLMLMKLPEINVNKVQTNYSKTMPKYWESIQGEVTKLFDTGTTEQIDIQTCLEKMGLLFIGSKEIKFKCNCSRDRMLDGIKSIVRASGIDHVFGADEDEIEAKCDYCKTSYLILRSEFINN